MTDLMKRLWETETPEQREKRIEETLAIYEYSRKHPDFLSNFTKVYKAGLLDKFFDEVSEKYDIYLTAG